MHSSQPQRHLLILAFAGVYFIWGSTYLAILFAIETMPTFTMIGARFVIGGALLYWVGRGRGAGGRPNRTNWREALITGILLMACGTGTVAWAEHRIPSSLAAVLVATLPIWMVTFDMIRTGRRRVARPVVAGIIVGLVGVVWIVRPGADVIAGRHVDVVGAVGVLIATMLWALGSIYSRYARLPGNPLVSAALQMLCGGGVLVVLGALTGELAGFEISLISAKSWWAFAYLILIGNLGFLSYAWLLRASTPAKVSTYAYVNPVVAVWLGWIMADERLTLNTLGAAALIISGVVMIVRMRRS